MDIKDFEAVEAKRIEINLALAEKGVRFVDIKRAYIDEGVTVGAGTLIYPDVYLEGKTSIGEASFLIL